MTEQTNSANRLYEVLAHAKKLVGNINMRTMVGWGNIFEVELRGVNSEILANLPVTQPFDLHYKTQLEIINRLLEFNKLINETKEKIILIPEIDTNLYLQPFPVIKRVASPAKLMDDFRAVISEISDADLVVLRFCSDLLHKHFPEKVIDETSLKDLLNEINELYERIKGLEIDFKLKEILLDILETMRQAIHEYRIRGIDRIEEAVADIIGRFFLYKDVIKTSDVKEVKEVGKLWTKFLGLYAFAADTVQLLGAGEAAKTVAEFITKLLGPGQ